MLEIKNLSYCYKHNDLLIDDLSLKFESSKSYLITGKSGCGKSSLGYLLSGLVKTEKGEIILNSKKITSDDCSMMFQNPNLQFCMDTVFNELIFVLENICVSPDKMEEKIDEALSFVSMKDYKYHKLSNLSGGQKQKIALASVYLLNRPVLILDEPFASLDEDSAKELLDKIYKLQNKRKFTLIIIDHLLDLYEKEIYSYYIFEDKNIKQVDYDFLKQKFSCFNILKLEKKYKEEVLKIENLNIKYGENKIIKNYNLNLNKNELLCLLGKSGSGKTTILNAIIGLVKYKGKIFLKNEDINKNFKKIGFLFQNPMDQFIYPRVYDEVFFTCHNEEITKNLLETMQLWEHREQSPFKLSQGQQRRLALAIIFSIPHDILVLDEPTYGQDRINAIKIMNMIVEYVNKYEPATIFTSHDKFIIENYSTRIEEVGI